MIDTWEINRIENLISFIKEEQTLGKIAEDTSEEIITILEEFTY